MKWAPMSVFATSSESIFISLTCTACNKPLIINICLPPTSFHFISYSQCKHSDKKLWKCFSNASSLNFFRFLISLSHFQRCRHFSISISPHNVVFIMQTSSSDWEFELKRWWNASEIFFAYLLIASKRYFFFVVYF